MMLTNLLKKLMRHESLDALQAEAAIHHIIADAPNAQIAAFLALLHAKGETVDELFGIICAMQSLMIRVPYQLPALDLVGTGGDGKGTVNISTAAALVVASDGVTVAKHGNRGVSSRCGSADLMEAMGIPIQASPSAVIDALNRHHFSFLFAPYFHPALKVVQPIRHELQVRTTFNVIGPLLNPTFPSHYLIGVYDSSLLEVFADLLQQMGVVRAMVVHGCGLDELSTVGPADVIEVSLTEKRRYKIDPKDYGFEYSDVDALGGGDASRNHQLLMQAFAGEQSAIADTIALTAGVAFYLTNHRHSIAEGISLARTILQEGRVIPFINRLRDAPHA